MEITKKATLFEVKARCETMTEKGQVKVGSNTYIIDGIDFADAHNRAIEHVSLTESNPQVIAMKMAPYTYIIRHISGGDYYKVKVTTIVINENSGKECKIKEYYMVEADSIENARQVVKEHLGCLTDYTIEAIAKTPIVEDILL